MARREKRINSGQLTLYGNKLIDDAKFTKTELIAFSMTKADKLSEEQLVTRCQYLQYGVCHIDDKGCICKSICDKWFTHNIPLIMKLSNKVSDQLEGVGIDTAVKKIEWLRDKMLRKYCSRVTLST